MFWVNGAYGANRSYRANGNLWGSSYDEDEFAAWFMLGEMG